MRFSIKRIILSFLLKLRFAFKFNDAIWNFRYAVVNKNYKYIYFRIPKAANTTVISSLLSNNKELDKKEIRKKVFDNMLSLLFIRTNHYTVFSVVRNPYTRVLSAYLQKIKKGSKKHLISIEFRDENDEVSFENFIRYLEAGGVFENGHWIPQSIIIPEAFKSLQIIKMEELQEKLPSLLSEINPSLFINNQMNHHTGASTLVGKFYNKQLAKRVFKLYENDFTRFRYDKGLP